MRDLLWLVPVFPLLGFLVNGILYLASPRTHGSGGHAPPAGAQPEAESSTAAGHPHAHGHAETAPKWKSLHTVVGTGSVGLSCLVAFAAILDVGIGPLSQ